MDFFVPQGTKNALFDPLVEKKILSSYRYEFGEFIMLVIREKTSREVRNSGSKNSF